ESMASSDFCLRMIRPHRALPAHPNSENAKTSLWCANGALKGRDAVRNSAKALAHQVPGARFQYAVKAVDSEHALLHWSAQSARANVDLVWIRLSFATVGLFYKPFLIN